MRRGAPRRPDGRGARAFRRRRSRGDRRREGGTAPFGLPDGPRPADRRVPAPGGFRRGGLVRARAGRIALPGREPSPSRSRPGRGRRRVETLPAVEDVGAAGAVVYQFPASTAGRTDGRLRRRPERGHLSRMRSLLRVAALAALLLGAGVSPAAPTPSPEPDVVRVFTLRHRKAEEAFLVVRPLLTARGSLVLQPALNALTVRDAERRRRAGRPGGRVVRRPPAGVRRLRRPPPCDDRPLAGGGADADRRAAPRRRSAAQEALQLHRLHAARRGRPPGARGRAGLLEPRRELPDRLPPRGGKRRRGRAAPEPRPRPGAAGREGTRDGAGRGADLDQPEDAGAVRPRRRPRGGGLGRALPRPVGRARRAQPRHRRAPLMPEFVCRVGTCRRDAW